MRYWSRKILQQKWKKWKDYWVRQLGQGKKIFGQHELLYTGVLLGCAGYVVRVVKAEWLVSPPLTHQGLDHGLQLRRGGHHHEPVLNGLDHVVQWLKIKRQDFSLKCKAWKDLIWVEDCICFTLEIFYPLLDRVMGCSQTSCIIWSL